MDHRGYENNESCSFNFRWGSKKILAEDGQPVEFGQTLIILNKK